MDDCDDLVAGQRVVLSSVLGCAARGEDPPCEHCAAGNVGRCDRVTVGHLKPGLQTGYCTETGGGWSRMMLAHRSQLWPVPDGMGDRDRGADRTARVRDPCGLPREDPRRRHRARRRRRHGGDPHPDRDQGAHEGGSRDRGGEAPTSARRGLDGRRRRRGASGARRESGPPDRTCREAHPGAWDGVPARRRRRRDRMHRFEQRARSRAAHDEGGWARGRHRHPGERRRSHPALVPRARARRRVHVRRRRISARA